VQVYQPRADDFAGNIQPFRSRIGRPGTGSHGGHLAIVENDIRHRIESRGRINDPTACQNQRAHVPGR
jgi:hypothetical protein